jgi:hypothetical protein
MAHLTTDGATLDTSATDIVHHRKILLARGVATKNLNDNSKERRSKARWVHLVLNEFHRPSADLAATAADLKVRLQIYKVQLLLLTRNMKVAKRELKVLMNMAPGRDSSTKLLLKSQLEYGGNYWKAVKLLSTPINWTEPVMLAMFYNNLGCITPPAEILPYLNIVLQQSTKV